MTDLTERLIALRDAPGADPMVDDHFFDHHTRELLAEAANRIEELEAERDHYREALEVAYWAYANLERDRAPAPPSTRRVTMMSDLTERLREIVADLEGVSPDECTPNEYAKVENDRDTLTEAANRIEELELAEMKNAGLPSQVIGRSGTSGSLIRTELQAERDRYREALRAFLNAAERASGDLTEQQMVFFEEAVELARAALSEQEGEG